MQHVKEVAFNLMASNGFDAVTVEQIAGASDVSPSTVYRYFGTKDALVLSSDRGAKMVERLRKDDSERTALEALRKAAVKVWGSDDHAVVELDLANQNETLLQGFERQLLDQRPALAAALAERRGAELAGNRDIACAAAGIGVLCVTLSTWARRGGGKKNLDKALDKAFTALT